MFANSIAKNPMTSLFSIVVHRYRIDELSDDIFHQIIRDVGIAAGEDSLNMMRETCPSRAVTLCLPLIPGMSIMISGE